MKKTWLIVVSVAVLLVVIGIVSYNLLPKEKVGALETIIPEYAISYWYSYNPSQKIKDFKSSELFKEIDTSSFYVNNIGPKIEEIKKSIPFDINEWLKQDAALAMFSFGDFKAGASRSSQVDFGDFLLLSRSNNGVKEIKKIIGNPLLKITKNKDALLTRYKGVMVITLKSPDHNITINITRLSDVILASNSMDLLEKSIDLFREKTHLGSLANNQKFNEISAKIKKDSLAWGYTDYRLYIKAFKEAVSKQKEDSANYSSLMLPDFFVNILGVFDAFSFCLDYDELKTGLIVKSYVLLNADNDQYGLSGIIAPKQEFDTNAFNIVPPDAIGFLGAKLDFSGLWEFSKKILSGFEDTAKKQLKNSPQAAAYQAKIDDFSITDTINKVDSFLGVNLGKDLIPLLGNNCGIFFTGFKNCYLELNSPQPFVMPELYCFVELKNIPEMTKTLAQVCQNIVDQANTFIKNQEKTEKKEEEGEEEKYFDIIADDYRGITVSSIKIKDLPLKEFKPNYFILDKYMIFALSKANAEKIIDLFVDKGQNFNTNFGFESAKKHFQKEYSSLSFLNVAQLLDNISSIEVLKSLVKSEDFRSIVKILHKIKGLSGTKKNIGQDIVESTGYIKIEGL